MDDKARHSNGSFAIPVCQFHFFRVFALHDVLKQPFKTTQLVVSFLNQVVDSLLQRLWSILCSFPLRLCQVGVQLACGPFTLWGFPPVTDCHTALVCAPASR